MRRTARPHVVPLACCAVAVGAACIAAVTLGSLTVGVIRWQQLLLADPLLEPPPLLPC
ncbi:hypothetical protein [Clavibacter nebraskensis]|uniref:hypothetical protein n=1 Tax=Clavibacter nebraskensis TaxID=31963 RepID=UPI003F858344